MDACREQGVEEPTWRWDGGFVIVTFKRPGKPSPNKVLIFNRFQTSTLPVLYQYPTSSLPVKTLIEKASDDFMTVWQLAELCGLKDIRYFRKNYLNPALEEGAIERLYPEQPKHPKQKYRLTEVAKEWKNKRIPKKPKDFPKK